MLLWIAIGGGIKLMMGHHTRSESLFYYFRLEDQVAENHLLRLIDTHIISCHPHERSSSTARARSLAHRGVQIRATSTEKGRSTLRRTEESQPHRPPAAPAAPVEVRPGAVLPGSYRPEHQAASPVPKPTDTVTDACQRIAAGEEGNVALRPLAGSKSPERTPSFSTPTGQCTR